MLNPNRKRPLKIDIIEYNQIRSSIDNQLKYCTHTIWKQSNTSTKKDLDVV